MQQAEGNNITSNLVISCTPNSNRCKQNQTTQYGIYLNKAMEWLHQIQKYAGVQNM
jgi:hypothetical protein